ncbi:hypothetical protein BDN67DRAFT_979080 [Paxillus ammoniavirescens]|nr:hypothetical protein BDN67DRAFT_979080 [Paxillus ammoniavirescens]
MQGEPASDYRRPATPDSTIASSLYHATSTIDDLTLALTSFSRVPSPEPQRQICCCCGNEDCEATKSWIALKSKLESRLILSAEVGSALLQRHEAYPGETTPRKASQDNVHEDASRDQTEGDARIAELLKENVILDKRLTQALLNNEVAEASSKTVLHELEEARSAVLRLTAHHARSVGLDTRLSTVLQENDDIRQERDSQTQRAKLAEARLAALKDRTDKLQAEVCRLQDDLEIRRLQRFESSESLLQGVRSRLEGLQNSHFGKSVMEENVEVTKVLESLVADNEILKADNEELHKLLTESREDLQALQALQREVGEHNIPVPPIQVETLYKHSRASSGPSSLVRDSFSYSAPQDVRQVLNHDFAVHTFGTDTEPEYDQGLLLENQATKGVQTDRWLGVHPTFFKADPTESGTATVGRSAVRKRQASQLSRGVDAVLDADTVSIRNVEDSEAGDIPGPLLERTLRRRGLSDSSIHSTFMNQGGSAEDAANSAESAGPWLERTSVLRTLSRTMQSFKQAASHTISGVATPAAAIASSSSSPPAPAPGTSDSKGSASGDGLDIHRSQQLRGSSAAFSLLLPGLTPWAAAGGALDSSDTYSPPQPNGRGSVREDATVPRLLGRESQGRDI